MLPQRADGESAGRQPSEPPPQKQGASAPAHSPHQRTNRKRPHHTRFCIRARLQPCRKEIAPKALPCCRRPSAEARSAWSRLLQLPISGTRRNPIQKQGASAPGHPPAPENESKESAPPPLLYQGTASDQCHPRGECSEPKGCPEQALSAARRGSNGCRKRVAPRPPITRKGY
jgi:hypothetical protein